jgi:hypothetical protein
MKRLIEAGLKKARRGEGDLAAGGLGLVRFKDYAHIDDLK